MKFKEHFNANKKAFVLQFRFAQLQFVKRDFRINFQIEPPVIIGIFNFLNVSTTDVDLFNNFFFKFFKKFIKSKRC